MKILEITIKKEVDDMPDLSFLGEYTDREEPWAICREHGEYVANLGDDDYIPRRGNEYRFFKPYAGGEPEGSEAFQKYGKQDFEKMERINDGYCWFYGIWGEARVKLTDSDLVQTITSGGLWGIEEDMPEAEVKGIVHVECCQLKRELITVGFSPRDINRATKKARDAFFQ